MPRLIKKIGKAVLAGLLAFALLCLLLAAGLGFLAISAIAALGWLFSFAREG